MINIKKIYQEIERRKEQAKEHYNEPYSIGRCDAFAEMLNFINSLEEKSEILKDFNEAAKEYANKEFPDEPAVGQWGTGDYEQPVDMEYPREIAEESFKAGAEWMVGQGVTEVSRLYRDPNPPHEGLFFGVLPFFSTLQMALNYQEGEEVIVQIRKREEQ